MYCKSCGTELDDHAIYCRKCGLKQDVVYSEKDCQAKDQEAITECENKSIEQKSAFNGEALPAPDPPIYSENCESECQADGSESIFDSINISTNSEIPAINTNRGTKWLSFICYFQLPFGALSAVSSALQMFTGSIYGESKEQVYSAYPSIIGINQGVGVAYLGVSAYFIYLSFILSRRRENAPKKYLLALFFAPIITFIYAIFAGIATGVSSKTFLGTSFVSNLIAVVILFFVNRTYFANRAYLFVENRHRL